MSYENVGVVVDGKKYEGWSDVFVHMAINDAERTFEIGTTEIGPIPNAQVPWHFPPGSVVQVMAGGDILIDGRVGEYNPTADATSHAVTISGYTRGHDYIYSSVKHETGRFENQTLLSIAQQLDVYGVGITALAAAAGLASQTVPFFQVRKGSTPWAEMMRLLPSRGLTMMGNKQGGIAIAKASGDTHSGGLIQGKNIKEMTAKLTDERYQVTEVDGQAPFGTEDEDFEVTGQATDGGASHYSYKNYIEEEYTNKSLAQRRAQVESARTFGQSVTADIKVVGWRDEGGRLWEPSNYVFVHAPFLHIEDSLLIESIDFEQSNDGGTVSTLHLVDGQAYDGSGAGNSPYYTYIPGGGHHPEP